MSKKTTVIILVVALFFAGSFSAYKKITTSVASQDQKSENVKIANDISTTTSSSVTKLQKESDSVYLGEEQTSSDTFVEKEFIGFSLQIPKEWQIERSVKYSYEATSKFSSFSWDSLKNDPDVQKACLKDGSEYDSLSCKYLAYMAKVNSIPNQTSQFLTVIGKKFADTGRDARVVESFSMHGSELVPNYTCRTIQNTSVPPFEVLRANEANDIHPCITFVNNNGVTIYAFTTKYVDEESYPGEFSIVYVIPSTNPEVGDIALSDEDFRFSLHKNTKNTTLTAVEETHMAAIRETLHDVVESIAFVE